MDEKREPAACSCSGEQHNADQVRFVSDARSGVSWTCGRLGVSTHGLDVFLARQEGAATGLSAMTVSELVACR